ncbi:MAG TPA: T3SS effector HopA1 family protein [Marmoricola sp.]|nr:T3SS effector HopA1 family protein [Marmoricola sp.]
MSHHEEIDRAVLLARKAAAGGRIDDPAKLTRLLYRHWFLGRRPLASVPSQRRPQPTTVRPDRPGSTTGSTQPWRSWGRLWTDDRPCRGADLVRLYLSCAPHTSLHAVAAVTEAARDWDHPWLLTSRALHQAAPGPDATVLYLPVAALDELREPVEELLGSVRPFLASTVPALTLEIARGAALAQNPADGRSFGVHRCSVVAGTVLASRQLHHREVIQRTFSALREAGVDPERPYRALGARWQWDAGVRAA